MKVALITGGASGLGKHTAQYLIKHGFRTVILDLPASNGSFIARKIGNDCLFVPTDITIEKDVKKAISKLKEKYGRLDVAVNCAGISISRKIFSFKRSQRHDKSFILSELNKVMQVNIIGTFTVNRHAVELMCKNERTESGYRGVVINVSSFSALEPQFGQAYEAITSGAINSFTTSLAQECISKGIRSVAIAPGIFRTPLITSCMTEQNLGVYERLVQFPSRLGTPEEFSALVCHIIGNEYLNGSTVRLDGALRMPP